MRGNIVAQTVPRGRVKRQLSNNLGFAVGNCLLTLTQFFTNLGIGQPLRR